MASSRCYPAYVALARSGEIARRVAEAKRSLVRCECCPRRCGANREAGDTGICGVGRWAQVASHFPHMGEEDCIRGWGGSGTIFFSGCNLGCVFCQNWSISHGCAGEAVMAEELAEIMLCLQEEGCHNLNWVTPSHVVPQALEALDIAAAEGLRLPIVYNTSGYDSLETLALLDGVVDIYLPDFKFWDPDVARRLAGAPDYRETACQAIAEMHRQVGDLVLDASGIAQRGLLVRHLVLPQDLAGTAEVARWLATEISPNTFLNLMSQYEPYGGLDQGGMSVRYRDLGRPVSPQEFRWALAKVQEAGLHRLDRRQAQLVRV